MPVTRAAIRSWCRARPALGHDELVAVAAALWQRPVFERRMAAEMLLELNPALLGPGDVPLIERMLREARTWALVDSLAADLMGGLVERYPALTEVLDRWAADADFWIRRSALLALLGPLRRGAGDFGRFSRYADQMLTEKEFFIRKAIGWVLRETAKKRPALVADWLAPRIRQVSGVTLREALKPLPPDVKTALEAARRASRLPPDTERGNGIGVHNPSVDGGVRALGLNVEACNRIGGQAHGIQQGRQLVTLGRGHGYVPRGQRRGKFNGQLAVFAAGFHQPEAVHGLRREPVREVAGKRLSPLDDIRFVHHVAFFGFRMTPGLPSSGQALQILPSPWTMTAMLTSSRVPRVSQRPFHAWLMGAVSGYRATSITFSLIFWSVQFAGNSVLPGRPVPCRWPPPVASPSRM